MATLDLPPDKISSHASDLEEHRRLITATTLLKEVFLNLVKNARTTRLYGADHHIPKRFLDAFIDHSLDFLQEFHLLNVEIEPEAIIYQGQEVLGAMQKGDQLAYGLYAEGLRGVSVERAASRRELKRLVDLLARDWLRRDEEAEDLMSAAWRADFQNVHVDVADRFSEEDERDADMVRDERAAGGNLAGGDQATLLGDSVLIAEVQGLIREIEAADPQASDVVKMKQDEVQVYLRIREEMAQVVEAGGDEDLMALDAGSEAALSQEVEQVNANKDASLGRMGELLFEIARLLDDKGEVTELGAALGRHILGFFDDGALIEVPALLHRPLGLLDADLFPDFELAGAFRKGLSTMIDGANAHRLVGALKRRAEFDGVAAPLFTILSAMPEEVIPLMVELGATAEDAGPLQQVLADALVTILRHDAQSVFELLLSCSEEQATVPLLAMARLDYPRSVEHSLLLARCDRPALREQALRSLRRYQSPNIRAAMLRALDDLESDVRLEALRYLSVYRDAADLGDLEQRIRSEWFGMLTADEVKGWLIAYGIIGREQAVPLLRNIALDVAKMHGEPDVNRSMAVRGLKAAGTATAKLALKQVAREQPTLRSLLRQLGTGA